MCGVRVRRVCVLAERGVGGPDNKICTEREQDIKALGGTPYVVKFKVKEKAHSIHISYS